LGRSYFEVLTSHGCDPLAEPSTGDHASVFDTDIITALPDIPKMINQRLQLGSFAMSSASP